MLFHRDRRTTKPAARPPLRPKGYGGIGPSATLPLLTDGRASVSSWRLASGPMALVTRPCRVLPRAANRVQIVIGILSLALLAGCSNADRIVIGSKNFTEQVILGELLAQHLENQTGLTVDRRLNLGGTFICHAGLVAGQHRHLRRVHRDGVSGDPGRGAFK